MRHPPTLAALAIAFLIAALIFGVLERWFHALPPKSIWRRERRVDILYWFFTPLVTRTIGLVAIAIAFALLALIAPRVGPTWFSRQPLAAQAIETIVAADFFGYWSHRLFHKRALWRFHAIHHSAEEVDWLAATRVHPLNEAIGRVMQFVPLYLLGFDGKAIAATLPLLTIYAIFLHANVRWDFGPLRYVIATPRFHRWHHTSEAEGLDRNFAGFFPWIDLMFGTFYLPEGREPQAFGVSERVPGGLLAQLAYPFTASK
jgi:sterol desaturase/sphingolipid hydroxylase (fatty acid hydroxylase superfamily)